MFAVILTLCTYAACNNYYVDKGATMSDCNTNLVKHANDMANVWRSDAKLAKYLKKFEIVEPVKMLTDYDYTCEFIPDSQIP